MSEVNDLRKKALEVKELYRQMNLRMGNKQWTVTDYTSGMVGDVGDFTKLVMAKQGLRQKPDVEAKLSHELCDILWCVFILADELKIDIEQVFAKNMEELIERVEHNEG